MRYQDVDFGVLVGTTLLGIEGAKEDSEEIKFSLTDGRMFRMAHNQDCCESVSVEDICGDLDDLIGSPIIQAEESSSEVRPEGVPEPKYSDDAQEWTFYRIATAKGLVVIRWYGSSNGYYSTDVDFTEVK